MNPLAVFNFTVTLISSKLTVHFCTYLYNRDFTRHYTFTGSFEKQFIHHSNSSLCKKNDCAHIFISVKIDAKLGKLPLGSVPVSLTKVGTYSPKKRNF